MPDAELDLRLHRLLFFSDGVHVIALTLLAVELGLPEAALRGRHLLDSLLESWPKVLAFLTSFGFIANFWAAHNILYDPKWFRPEAWAGPDPGDAFPATSSPIARSLPRRASGGLFQSLQGLRTIQARAPYEVDC
jgi:hypothetical protein